MIDMFVKEPKGSSVPGSFVVFYSCLFAITHLLIVVLVRKLNGFILPDCILPILTFLSSHFPSSPDV